MPCKDISDQMVEILLVGTSDYGNKWSLGAMLRYLRSNGRDTSGRYKWSLGAMLRYPRSNGRDTAGR